METIRPGTEIYPMNPFNLRFKALKNVSNATITRLYKTIRTRT